MLVYVSDETAASLGRMDGRSDVDAVLFPSPWKSFENLLFVPYSRLVRARDRQLTLDNGARQEVLDAVIR
jgi:hypothetical protein